MSILNRWRQFSRGYFYQYLLFWIFAIRFIVLLLPGSAQKMLHQTNSCPVLILQSLFHIDFSQLIWMKDVTRRPADYTVDYCNQNSIRNVISYLLIALVLALLPVVVAPLYIQHQVLLIILDLLINCKARQPMPVRFLNQTDHIAFINHCTGIRLAQFQKIRASPAHSRLSFKNRNFSANDFWPTMGGHDEI